MERISKLLLKGDIEGAVKLTADILGEYGRDFIDYFELMEGLTKSFNPESYHDPLSIMKTSLTAVMKKAYKKRDYEKIRVIKDIIQIIKGFEVEDDIS
ncbi:hypothetical protein [Persephonella sp.]|uniref:hypothetical protein n=1 Tax=Persephonella sp. TaxID=2060922 RepID=UPI002600331E|nr:hypothetical protein [Persephonella sp.]